MTRTVGSHGNHTATRDVGWSLNACAITDRWFDGDFVVVPAMTQKVFRSLRCGDAVVSARDTATWTRPQAEPHRLYLASAVLVARTVCSRRTGDHCRSPSRLAAEQVAERKCLDGR